VQAMYAKADARAQTMDEEAEAMQAAQEYMLHGMSRDELEAVMKEVFGKADVDGSGALSLSEFQKCISEAELGLTRKEINRLMQEVDADGDGVVTYEEFVPLCFDMLVELLKEELMNSREPNELEEYLMALWTNGDVEGSGYLTVNEMRDLLRSADFGLTRLQIHTILAVDETMMDEHGRANYAKLAPTAAKMIYSMLDSQTLNERQAAIKKIAAEFTYNGRTDKEVESVLLSAFGVADTAGVGTLPLSAIRSVLESCELKLAPHEVMGMLSMMEDGVPYAHIAQLAFKFLREMAAHGVM